MGEASRRKKQEQRGRATPVRRSRARRRIPWIPIVLVAAVVLGGFFLVRSFGAGSPGRSFPDLGRTHLQEGQPFANYNSTPPTSGPHWPAPAPWGVYDVGVPDERTVHNLEHGGIVISYNAIAPPDLDRLKDLRVQYARAGKQKLLIRPYDKIPPGTIALTAWTWLDTLQTYDEARVRAFIDAHIGNGPEPQAP